MRKLAKYGEYEKSSEIVSDLTNSLKQKEMGGYEYEAAEASFDIIMRKALKDSFPFSSFRTIIWNPTKPWKVKAKPLDAFF